MAMNVIPFEAEGAAGAIAVISKQFGNTAADLIGTNGGSGFPVVSIKGKVFHIQRGDERTLVTKPGEDDPASSIEVVIIRANPARSKVYYTGGYQEGDRGKPVCYSNDGVAPAADAAQPQSKTCATCTHNQWGSKITDTGGKTKACTDSRRLAIATVDAPMDPMLIRVPAGSMKALEEYGKILAARTIPPQAVVTKIGFDHSVAFPSLTFRPVGLIGDAKTLRDVAAMQDNETVRSIVGLPAGTGTPAPVSESEANAVVVLDEPVPVKAEAVAPTPPKAAKPKAAEAPKAQANVAVAPAGTLDSSIAAMLKDLEFDA